MSLFSIFQSGGKYFDKKMPAKCDYCQYGKRSNAGNKIICERKGLVDPNSSCGSFIYSPLKRIPVKQLNFVGSLADEDIYIESAGERAEKEAAKKKNNKNDSAPKEAEKEIISASVETPAEKAPDKPSETKNDAVPKETAPQTPAAPEEEKPIAAKPDNAQEAPKTEKTQDAVNAEKTPEPPVTEAPKEIKK